MGAELLAAQMEERASGGELELVQGLRSIGSFRASSPGPSLSRQVRPYMHKLVCHAGACDDRKHGRLTAVLMCLLSGGWLLMHTRQITPHRPPSG